MLLSASDYIVWPGRMMRVLFFITIMVFKESGILKVFVNLYCIEGMVSDAVSLDACDHVLSMV